MQKIKAWISAARLRTLPLSLAGIIVGAAIAGLYGYQNTLIFILALCTTIAFQVTSNFANDYGDGVKGTDNEERIGPKRALQSGLLTRQELKMGIIITILIDLLLITAIVYYAFGIENLVYVIVFILLGIFSIWAAIKYTVGSSAYGYKGLGDVFVFLFFGLLSSLGTYFLLAKSLTLSAVLPASAIGFLSTAVLNLNNLRDIKSDANAGKNTLVVKMGYKKGKQYHAVLITLAFTCLLVFTCLHYQSWKSFLHLLVFIPLFIHLTKVSRTEDPVLLDPELKKVALSTFFLSLLFYFGFNNFL